MSSILNSPDILAALQQRKRATGRKLKASRTRISERANLFWAPLPQTASRAQHISRFVSNGLIIYNGIRICSNILSAVQSIFGRRRRRR